MEYNSILHLFSTFVTLHTLILIYAPSFFLKILLSPVLNSTGIILLFLLKLGANKRLEKESKCLEQLTPELTCLEQRFPSQTHPESHQTDQAESDHDLGLESNSHDEYYKCKFLKWNLKAPLEIIYEAYEGEEEDDDEDDCDRNGMNMVSSGECVSGLERYPSLSMYYPESETDSSSDDDQEELIEISVDRYKKASIEFCCIEEDNLIEINIFRTRN